MDPAQTNAPRRSVGRRPIVRTNSALVGDIHLSHDIGPVQVDRFRTNAQRLGNILAGATIEKSAQTLEFAC